MSIEGSYGTYNLECDICGADCGEDFDSFYEAVEWKKDKSNGWFSRKTSNGWYDICPDCNTEKTGKGDMNDF